MFQIDNFLNNIEYLSLNCNTIIEEGSSEIVNNAIGIDIKQILDLIIEIMPIILSVVAIIGGAWFFVEIRRLKEKRLDATFSFLTRLGIHLTILKGMFEKNKHSILNPLCITNVRSSLEKDDENNSYASETVKKFLNACKETLKFLMETDNQVPIQQGWVDKYNTFVTFLDIYVKTEDVNYFYWTDDFEKNKNDFYTLHMKNIESMLIDISNEQKLLEIKITKESFPKQICIQIKTKIKTHVKSKKKEQKQD